MVARVRPCNPPMYHESPDILFFTIASVHVWYVCHTHSMCVCGCQLNHWPMYTHSPAAVKMQFSACFH